MITTGNANFVSPTKKRPGRALGPPSERPGNANFYVGMSSTFSYLLRALCVLCVLCAKLSFFPFGHFYNEKPCSTEARRSQSAALTAPCRRAQKDVPN